jgi:hypothetical protein
MAAALPRRLPADGSYACKARGRDAEAAAPSPGRLLIS